MMKCALQKDPFPGKVRECVSVLEVTPLFVDFFHCPILFLSFFLSFFLQPHPLYFPHSFLCCSFRSFVLSRYFASSGRSQFPWKSVEPSLRLTMQCYGNANISFWVHTLTQFWPSCLPLWSGLWPKSARMSLLLINTLQKIFVGVSQMKRNSELLKLIRIMFVFHFVCVQHVLSRLRDVCVVSSVALLLNQCHMPCVRTIRGLLPPFCWIPGTQC